MRTPNETCDLLYKHPYEGAGANHPPETPEFIIRVYPDELNEWKKNPTGIPLVQVVDAMEVYICQTRGHTGMLKRPSSEQLLQAFGSTKFEDIFPFMVEHGHIQHSGKHTDFAGKEKGVNIMGKTR